MTIDTRYAHISCSCGQKFQALAETAQEDGTVLVDWDETKTAAEYTAHQEVCEG